MCVNVQHVSNFLIFSVLIPDFDTNDLNTLLPWLYGDGSDEQQPNPELVKAMSIGKSNF